MSDASERLDASDHDAFLPEHLDIGAHLVQHVDKIEYFRTDMRSLDGRHSLGKAARENAALGRTGRANRQIDVCAGQSVLRLCVEISTFRPDLCTHLLKYHDVQVDLAFTRVG